MKNFPFSFAVLKISIASELETFAEHSLPLNNHTNMNLLDFFDIDFPIDRQSFIYRSLFLGLVLAGLYFLVKSEVFV